MSNEPEVHAPLEENEEETLLPGGWLLDLCLDLGMVSGGVPPLDDEEAG